ncbi:MAG: hypothetical protein ACJA0H_000686 [Francisellaceae bacterium]|jgi:hypothetical protein
MTNEYMNQFKDNMKKLTEGSFADNMKKLTEGSFNPMSDSMKNLTKNHFESATEIQKIATETFEYYTRKNMEAFTSMFENTTKKVQSLAEIKKAEDFAKFCTDCAKEASEAAVAFSKEAIQDSVSVSKKYSTVIEKSVKESTAV